MLRSFSQTFARPMLAPRKEPIIVDCRHSCKHRRWIGLALVLGLLAASSQPSIARCEEPKSAPAAAAASEQKVQTSPAKQHRNRLADETSPYLLLHAHNPVDWYPWGEEALAKAKRENKPIFLSIGYSSCHWCHVMERESFLDEEIAAVLNEHFVCIKVDREERPDIDSIYMTALHVFNQLTRSGRGGGWPLSMFLTPDAKPFYGGTYFPARDGDRGVSTGFLTIVRKIDEVWKNNADTIKTDADTITRITRLELAGQRPSPLFQVERSLLDSVQKSLAEQYDAKYGGFGYAAANPLRPKFPEPSNLYFLIDRIQRQRAAGQDDAQALDMLTGTLEKMAQGGIRDHLGGGFHRYSVDRFWRIPHFEKMLYDNGQLASIYAEAHQLTGRDDFRRVAEELLDFVLREMRDERGGFYAALDAESEGEEGKFYRWTADEVRKLLTADEYELFAAVYGLDRPPNFEEEYYAPQLRESLAQIAAERSVDELQLEKQLAPIRAKLLAARDDRPRPLTDSKILTGWNGLMIRGLADAGRILDRPDYTSAAKDAADFVLAELRTSDGRLLRAHAAGESKLNAYVDDYAFFIDGLIALYRASGEQKWLDAAGDLTDKQIELFWDDEAGGFFFTSGDHEQLIARGKNPVDGALPAGNSVSAENLLFLAGAASKPEYSERAEQTIRSVSGFFAQSPAAAPRMAVAAALLLAAQANDDEGDDGGEKRIVGKTLAEWSQELKTGDDLARLEAARTLPLFGAAAAEPLAAALDDKHAGVRMWVATALGDLKAGDVERIAPLLDDKSLGVRIAAAYAILRQQENEKALAILTGALSYPGRGAPIHAADFLGKLKAKAALPALVESAKSEDYHVKNSSLRAIRQIEQDNGGD